LVTEPATQMHKRSDGGNMASKEWNAWRIVMAREYSGSHGWRPGWKGEGDCSLPTSAHSHGGSDMGVGRATAALRARAGPCAKLGERVVRLRRGWQAAADERAHTDVRAATSDRGASLWGDDCASHVFSCSALPALPPLRRGSAKVPCVVTISSSGSSLARSRWRFKFSESLNKKHARVAGMKVAIRESTSDPSHWYVETVSRARPRRPPWTLRRARSCGGRG
jgi:hypothetical protein